MSLGHIAQCSEDNITSLGKCYHFLIRICDSYIFWLFIIVVASCYIVGRFLSLLFVLDPRLSNGLLCTESSFFSSGCRVKNNGFFTTRPTYYMYNFSKWFSVHGNTPSTSNLWWHSYIWGKFRLNLIRAWPLLLFYFWVFLWSNNTQVENWSLIDVFIFLHLDRQ